MKAKRKLQHCRPTRAPENKWNASSYNPYQHTYGRTETNLPFHVLILRFTSPTGSPVHGAGNFKLIGGPVSGDLLYEGNCGYKTKQSQMQHTGKRTVCAYGWHLHFRPMFQCFKWQLQLYVTQWCQTRGQPRINKTHTKFKIRILLEGSKATKLYLLIGLP